MPGRHREDHPLRPGVAAAVKQIFLALARMDPELLAAADPRNPVGIKPGGVHHVTGADFAAVRRGQAPAAVRETAGNYFKIAVQIDTVADRRFHQAEHITVGLNGTAAGSEETADRLLVQFGFELHQPGMAAHFEVAHTVGDTLFIEPLHRRHLFFAEGDHQYPVAAERETKLVLQFVEHQVATDFQLRLQCVHRMVKPAVDDARVGFGNSEADIDALLQQHRRKIIVGQLVRGARAGNSRTDHRNVVDHHGTILLMH